MANLLECWICGTKHEYCPNCGRTHSWKYIADTPKCYQIYMVFAEYRDGTLSKEQAKKDFAEKCDIKPENDLSWMLPNFEKEIRDIIGEKERTVRSTKKSKLFE